MNRFSALEKRVDEVSKLGLRRTLRSLNMISGTMGILDGREVHVFCSNDYLGLAHHPEVLRAFEGAGSGASRLISGNRPAHQRIESQLGEMYGRPVTLFSSGYHANLALMSTVLVQGDTVCSDALNHASIIDGLRLSRAHRVVINHGAADQIDPLARMVVVEGLYSMDGDTLNLADYAGEPWLAVDEAHSVGVLGPSGRGVAAMQGVEPDFLVGTLGKAFGSYGAFVVGPPSLRELLISRGRSFIFTTGLPESVVNAALVALTLATDERRQRLADRVARFRRGLFDLGLSALGAHHIVPVVFGAQTMRIAEALLQHGFWAAGIRAPTVPSGTERVRFTLSAEHTPTQIDQLLDAINFVLQEIDYDCA